MKELSERQAAVKECMRRHILEHGFAPTHKEVAALVGLSPARVAEIIKEVVKKGHMKPAEGRVRGVTLVDEEGVCPCCRRPL